MKIRAIVDDHCGGYAKGDVFDVVNDIFIDRDNNERSYHSNRIDFEIIADEDVKSTNPFLKTVTETRVFSGEQTICGILDLSITLRNDNTLTMRFANGDYVVMDKQSLAELARILNEISEAM